LTCDFWAENAKNKCRSFGLASWSNGLRSFWRE
jgi:hypothetical protein